MQMLRRGLKFGFVSSSKSCTFLRPFISSYSPYYFYSSSTSNDSSDHFVEHLVDNPNAHLSTSKPTISIDRSGLYNLPGITFFIVYCVSFVSVCFTMVLRFYFSLIYYCFMCNRAFSWTEL